MNHLLEFISKFGIETMVGSGILLIQVIFFRKTKQKIKRLESIFPLNDFSRKNTQLISGEDPEILLIKIPTNAGKQYADIITSVNNYLKSNKGTADFDILKSMVENDMEVAYDDINAQINVPLYIGLMGTFLGVVLGLVRIVINKTIDETNILFFIAGVLIAMTVSLIGLLLTVISNAGYYKKSKKIGEQRKNAFLKFLQTELWPSSSKGLAEAVNTFKNNIDNFNSQFGANIKLFDDKLSEQIGSLTNSVGLIAANINAINENTKSNYNFLKELKSGNFQQLVDANLKFAEVTAQITPRLIEFSQNQQQLNDSIEKSVQMAASLTSVMDRIKRFEEGVNNLGDRIDNADYMGSDLLHKVNLQLDDLDKRFNLLKQHSQTTSGHIEALLQEEKQKIEDLCKKIITELQLALQFNLNGNPFKKLELLESIDKSLQDTRSEVTNIKNIKEKSVLDHKENGNGSLYRGNREYKEQHEYVNHGNAKRSFFSRIFPFLRSKHGKKA